MATRIRIRRGNKSDLPVSAPSGMLLWCEDTEELYIGTGDSVIKPITADSGLKESDVYTILAQGVSKSGNGYLKIPVGEDSFVIIQWGQAASFGFGTSRDIYFPMVFPVTCASVTVSASYYQGAGNKGSTAQVYRVAANRFHITSRFEQGSASLDWIAIGW